MIIDLEIPGLERLTGLERELGAVEAQARATGEALGEAFDPVSLERKVITLKSAFTRLKNAIAEALAPIAGALYPVLSQALNGLTRLANQLGALFAALFGGVVRQVRQTKKVTGSAARAFLADFDQIQRIGTLSGSGGTVSTVETILPPELPEEIRRIVERIRYYLHPLTLIDLTPLKTAFAALVEAIRPIGKGLFAGLEWLWMEILVPMAEFGTEQLLPAFLETVTEALGTFENLIRTAQPALHWLWQELLQPMAAWTGGAILQALQFLREKFAALGQWILDNRAAVQDFIKNVGELAIKFGAVKLAVELLNSITGGGWGGLGAIAMGVIAVTELIERLKIALGQAKNEFDLMLYNLNPVIKGVLNGISRVVNGVIGAMESVLNAAIRGINAFKLDFPSWMPLVGGGTWGPNIPAVNLPRIPALARGAVLPANKPFLAMVGDQSHGTNVEAPLSTIQEAVAQVMGASLEGQDRTEALLTQILGAILGIQVGDEVIGRAARRYEQRLAGMGGV